MSVADSPFDSAWKVAKAPFYHSVNTDTSDPEVAEKLFRLRDELLAEGISFDEGGAVGGGRDWELDWSLSGATPDEVMARMRDAGIPFTSIMRYEEERDDTDDEDNPTDDEMREVDRFLMRGRSMCEVFGERASGICRCPKCYDASDSDETTKSFDAAWSLSKIDGPRNNLHSKYGFRCTNCHQPMYSLSEARKMGVRGVPKGEDAMLEIGFCPDCGGFSSTMTQRMLSESYSGPFDSMDAALDAFTRERIARSLGAESGHRVKNAVRDRISRLVDMARDWKTNEIDWEKLSQLRREERDRQKMYDQLGLLDRGDDQ